MRNVISNRLPLLFFLFSLCSSFLLLWFFIPSSCSSWRKHFTLFSLARKFGSHFVKKSSALSSINCSVLIIFLIGKVITGFLLISTSLTSPNLFLLSKCVSCIAFVFYGRGAVAHCLFIWLGIGGSWVHNPSTVPPGTFDHGIP